MTTIYSAESAVLCNMLKDYREQAKLTQEQLGERLGMSQAQIAKIENGQRRLDIVEAWRFCEAVRVPFPEFAQEFERRLKLRSGL